MINNSAEESFDKDLADLNAALRTRQLPQCHAKYNYRKRQEYLNTYSDRQTCNKANELKVCKNTLIFSVPYSIVAQRVLVRKAFRDLNQISLYWSLYFPSRVFKGGRAKCSLSIEQVGDALRLEMR